VKQEQTLDRATQSAIQPYSGSICAIVTPFLSSGEPDLPAFSKLVQYQIWAGSTGIVVAGSTGESAALEESEFVSLLELARKIVSAKAPVSFRLIAGTGLPNTQKTLRLTQIARDCGADAALIVTPAYVRPTAEGLYRHYSTLADLADLPIILYNVPSRTGCDLLPDITARLCTHPQIIGIKEALPVMERLRALLALQSVDFAVLSGDDPTALEAFKLGAVGLISVAANAVPRHMSDLFTLSSTNLAEATQLNAALAPLFDALALEPNPIPIKWALAELNLCTPELRLPLTTLSDVHHPALRNALNAVRQHAKLFLHQAA
jgi:4-hydroxy-tetrahydrodipicolinate synthase